MTWKSNQDRTSTIPQNLEKIFFLSFSLHLNLEKTIFHIFSMYVVQKCITIL